MINAKFFWKSETFATWPVGIAVLIGGLEVGAFAHLLFSHVHGRDIMAKIKPTSTNPDQLADTVRTMLGKKVVSPLSVNWLIDCVEMMPFSLVMKFDKIFGRYIVSNEDESEWPPEGLQSNYHGTCFTIVDLTLEMAMARAVHYYFHTEIREEVKS